MTMDEIVDIITAVCVLVVIILNAVRGDIESVAAWCICLAWIGIAYNRADYK